MTNRDFGRICLVSVMLAGASSLVGAADKLGNDQVDASITRWKQQPKIIDDLRPLPVPREMAHTTGLVPNLVGITNVFLGMSDKQFRDVLPDARPEVDYRDVPIKGAHLIPAMWSAPLPNNGTTQRRILFNFFQQRVIGLRATFIPSSPNVRKELVSQYVRQMGKPSAQVLIYPYTRKDSGGSGLLWTDKTVQLLVAHLRQFTNPAVIVVDLRANGYENLTTAVHMKRAEQEDLKIVEEDFPESSKILNSSDKLSGGER